MSVETVQEARHIVAALMQHFTYNEFLPMVLGKEVMHNNDLVLLKDGYWNKYDQFLNPSTSNGFTIAFRWTISCSFKIYITIQVWSHSSPVHNREVDQGSQVASCHFPRLFM